MRAIPTELQARLDSGATTLCRCWRVERTDGFVLGFTDHDTDLEFAGVIFRAGTGVDASALQAGTGLSVDNGQAMGALTAAAVTEKDVRAGRFDNASVQQWIVDWSRPDLRVLMFSGTFGEIRRSDHAFEVELRGLSEALNVPVGRSLLKTCDRALGDAKCGVDLSIFSVEGTVRAEATGSQIAVETKASEVDGWFQSGVLIWLSGANAGLKASIKRDRRAGGGRQLDLWVRPVLAVGVGDRVRLIAGCDKQAVTCRSKFDNFVNFRGFPHIPGEDWVTAYPKSGGNNDGGRLRS